MRDTFATKLKKILNMETKEHFEKVMQVFNQNAYTHERWE